MFEPRTWVTPDGDGATIVPGAELDRWLRRLPGGEVSAADISALRERSQLDWSQR